MNNYSDHLTVLFQLTWAERIGTFLEVRQRIYLHTEKLRADITNKPIHPHCFEKIDKHVETWYDSILNHIANTFEKPSVGNNSLSGPTQKHMP